MITHIAIAALALAVIIWAGLALHNRRQLSVMAAELANARDARDATLRALDLAVEENVRLRRRRPLILNGRVYVAYRVLPESIYRN